VINHELFQTPMAKEPQFQRVIKEKDDLDIKYQLVKDCGIQKKWAINEIVSELKSQF